MIGGRDPWVHGSSRPITECSFAPGALIITHHELNIPLGHGDLISTRVRPTRRVRALGCCPQEEAMSHSRATLDPEAQALYDRIVQRGRAVITGVKALTELRRVLERVVEKSGVVIEWDPSTPAALRERLSVISLSALRWTVPGAAAGLVLGAFTEKPGLWMLACVGIGAALGAVQGHCAVESGWRLRGYRDEQGVEHVEVIVRALPQPAAARPTETPRREPEPPWWEWKPDPKPR